MSRGARLAGFGADWPAVSALLDEALALPAGERDAWLASLAGERATHREALRALLATQAELETGDYLAELPRLPPPEAAPDAEAGQRVGPWRLVSEIARGGMGTVWLAERDDGVMTRRVALKRPRVAWDDAFAARLARERRILAALEHPHIARLYDAGADERGRPWLAMEFVDGQPIDTWARGQSLDLRARVALLLQVMDAVAHAHARLVVHRDLKPANILVTPAGHAMLLDFGIARLLHDERTDGGAATAVTELAGRALTLAYASPEQVRGEAPGTASDVYSLGVVACELLAGARPYRLRRTTAAALEEAIVAEEPRRPSEVAGDRATARALRGDLDAIVGKALRKAPGERYATVDAFARDLRHWLLGEPVEARPDAPAYRAAKFVRRHRGPVALGALAAIALVAGSTVAAWQAHAARREAAHARQEAATATATTAFLEDIFRLNGGDEVDPDRARATTARELLDRGAERIDGALHDAPEARLRLLGTLSSMYGSMALLEKSAELERRRVELARATFGTGSREAAEALAALGNALAFLDQRQEALADAAAAEKLLDALGEGPSRIRYGIAMTRALVGQRDDYEHGLAAAQQAVADARARHDDGDLVHALQVRSEIAGSMDDGVLARDGAREAIDIATRDPAHGGNQLSALYVALADAQGGLGDLDGADASYRRALAVADERNAAAPIYRHTAERRYGSFLRRNGRLRGAVEMHRPGYEWARANPAGYGTIAPTLVVEYGRALVAWGRPAPGLAVLDEGLALQRQVGGDAPETVAGIELFRAQALADLGRADDARAALKRAHAFYDGTQESALPAAVTAQVERTLALRAGRADEALRAWRAARVAQHQPPDPGPKDRPRVLADAAQLHLAAGDTAAAEAFARAALAQLEADPKRVWRADTEAGLQRSLGTALLREGRAADAVPVLARAVELARDTWDPLHAPVVADTLDTYAQAARRAGDPATAATAAAEARRIRAAD